MIQFRPYTSQLRFTDDFHRVRDFIQRVNKVEPVTPDFHWGRWEWMFSLPYLDDSALDRIGIWEDNGQIVALVTYESHLGEAFSVTDPHYNHLQRDLLIYARDHLAQDGQIRFIIPDGDRDFQRSARQLGYRPTTDKQEFAVIDITDDIQYTLRDRFKIVSLADDNDIWKYSRVLHKGFNHGDQPRTTPEEYERRKISLSGPHNNLDIKIAVQAPNGEFAAYCGMWYDPSSENALVEPVATDPAYRKMGLGKAAVLEGVIRCGKLGAKRAYVGSSQQFYYNIGFDPLGTNTWWELKL